MDKLEELEDLKRNLLNKIKNSEDLPENLRIELEKQYAEVLKIYDYHRCLYPSTEEYVNGNKKEAFSYISRVGEETKENEIDQTQYIIRKMVQEEEEKELEDKLGLHKDEIKTLDGNTSKDTEKIIGIITDSLKDIHSAQIRLMSSRGCSPRMIEEVTEDVRRHIRSIEMGPNGDKINQILNVNLNDLRNQLANEYDNFVETTSLKQDSKKEETRIFGISEIGKGILPQMEDTFGKQKEEKIIENETEKGIESLENPFL